MKALSKLLVAAVVVVIGSVGFAYSGFYDVSASSTHGGLVNWLLSRTSHASIERRARSISVPELTDTALVRAGVNDFDAMCAACHGAPGKEPEAMGLGLNPLAPDLAESAVQLNAAELFWVTKNGIKMTGMPAWGATHDDDALWPVVAFMTTLPDLDADGYQALLASAAGVGHHAEGDDQGDHEHDDSNSGVADASDTYEGPAPEKEAPPHDDGHDHSH